MAKAFKWQLFIAEIFQRAVDQFIAAPLMVALNQPLRCKKITAAASLKPLIYPLFREDFREISIIQ